MRMRAKKQSVRNVQLAACFADLFKPARYKVYSSGRGAGKSWGFALALVLTSLTRTVRVLCAREFQNSMTESVHKLLGDTIQRLGLRQAFSITRNDIIGPNGSNFIFKGLRRDINEIKSLEGIDIVWVEEAQAVSGLSWEVLIPTIRKPGSEIWLSFNPMYEDDATWQRFVASPRPGSIVRRISWRDNPWFPDILRQEMEYDYSLNEERARHIWEGDFRVDGGSVFKEAWFKYHEYGFEARFDDLIITADTALKAEEQNDFSVLSAWGRIGSDAFLLDQVRGKWEAPELLQMAKWFYGAWSQHIDFNMLYVEDAASGTGLVQFMKKDGIARVDYIKRGSMSRKSKVERANFVAPCIHDGYVYLPKDAEWLPAFIKEITRFSADMLHPHDDQVDTMVDALHILLMNGIYSPPFGGGMEREQWQNQGSYQ